VEDLFGWRLPLGEMGDTAAEWLKTALGPLWSFVGNVLRWAYGFLVDVLALPPWWFVIVLGGVLCWFAAREFSDRGRPNWQYGVGAAGLLLVLDTGLFLFQRFVEIPAGEGQRVALALWDIDPGTFAFQDPFRPSFMLLFLPSSSVVILLFAVLAALVRGWQFGLITVAGLLVIDLMGMWNLSMVTLAMVLVAVTVAGALAIPVGILAAKSRVASTIVRPVLDVMQTMPVMVYVIIALVFFRLGVVPGIVATIVFAMPPGIRLTELGIRQVDAEVVEAGHAFGSPPRKILQQIQLPLALPTIMAGVNQVIMLSLSMVVLAGFVGAPGLGQRVTEGISRARLDFAIEAGLSIVILAIILDRLTAAIGARSTFARLERGAA
jgi:ABC-type proline/glycine betaine transport system permease subunit